MAKKFDVVYGVRREGQEKTRWINCGAMFETEKGLSIKLDTIPVGFDGWLKLFEPKPREDAPRRASEPQRDEDFSDDSGIPF